MRILPLLSLLALSLALVAGDAAYAADPKKVLYRYQDERGKMVLNDKLPPEAVMQGYDILRRDGTLVKTVSGKPTDEELQRLNEQKVREEETRRLQEWDESLLLRYSEVADIEAAKQRALKEIEVRIAILDANLRHLKRQVEAQQAMAADAEQATDHAPEELEKNLRELKWQISDMEEMIASRRQERRETSAAFDRDIHRFKTLISRIGKRQ